MKAIWPAPDGDSMHIGSRLRTTRKAQGLTLEQVAEATGLTKGFISRVERDVTSPSVLTLVTLCQVLSLPIGSLFEEPAITVVTLDNAPSINMGGRGVVDKLLTPRAQSGIQLLRSIAAPGSDGGKELYTINCELEVLHVLKGSLEVHLSHEKVQLVEGDTLTLPGREPHSWANTSQDAAEVLWILVPAAWSGSS